MRAEALLPIECSLLPCVDEAKGQFADKDHHRNPRGPAEREDRDGPRIQERGLEIEDDEEDGDQVEAYVELAPRILECGKAALVFAELLRRRLCDPVRRETAIGRNTNVLDNAMAIPRNRRIGR